jgi:threonyl-tRNA synthetase
MADKAANKSEVQSKQERLDQEKSDLFKVRHTAEHILHQAVKELYPSIHLAMGPATDEGFYFDFDSSPEGREEVKISEADFPKIEKRMKQIIQRNAPLTRHEISVAEARELFADNPYKLEWIDGIEAKGEKATVYWTGKPGEKGSMVDLCAGPHAESTGKVKAFKLLSLAGAYWHGDENNKMLTRIYGTAFLTQEELDQFVHLREEAKKRDHKILGPKLDLFTFSEKVGSGLPLWTPRGTMLRNVLDGFVQELRKQKGYVKVEIPHITKKDLYETSGHWAKFSDELFKIETREKHLFAMKPMNCPHHTQIFDRKPHSYREMPQRYANTTMVYRDEQSGELAGLSRVRCITQDDAHVFCRESQVKEEAYAIWDIIETFYKGTGFAKLKLRLSLHDPNNFGAYLGTKETWAMAENQLRDMLIERKAEFFEAQGEAAFYGPKIDFMAYDSLGREWQVATIQIDRNMPERFDLSCINEAGEKERVVMLHAAIMGSIERFMSILIEHHAGAFPLWMAPTQVSILPIADRHLEYADEVAAALRAQDIRVEVDSSSERLSKKIRDAQLDKVPYMLIIGDEEVAAKEVGVRNREAGDQGKLKVEVFVQQVVKQVADKVV